MKKKKKGKVRWLSVLLTGCLLLSTIPATAFAAEDTTESESMTAEAAQISVQEGTAEEVSVDSKENTNDVDDNNSDGYTKKKDVTVEVSTTEEVTVASKENTNGVGDNNSDTYTDKKDITVEESKPSEQPDAKEESKPSEQPTQGVKVDTIVRNNYTDTRTNVTIYYKNGIALVDGDQSALNGSVLTFTDLGDLTIQAAYDSASNKTTLTLDISKIPRKTEEQTYYTEYRENESRMTTTLDRSELSYYDDVTEPGSNPGSGTGTSGEGTSVTITEIRDDYYTRNHVYERACLTIPAAESTPTVKVIDVVEINDVTVSFKDGDKPVFTGKVPEGAGYAFRCEWWSLDENTGLVSTEPEWGGDIYKNKITAFEAGKTYHYGVYVTAYTADISSGAKLKINGQEVSYTRIGNNDEMQTFWVETNLTMTPEAGGTTPAEKYTVTYTDGVNGEEIFNDQSYTVESGKATPAFSGTPARKGYTFAGWKPSVAATVTDNATYEATWKSNSATTTPSDNKPNTGDNGNGKNSTTLAENKSHTVTTPETGDTSNIVLWIALLFVSSGALVGAVAIFKKKKFNR